MKSSNLDVSNPIWILGQEYPPLVLELDDKKRKKSASDGMIQFVDDTIVGPVLLLEDIQSRVVITYRFNFPAIQGSSFVSDVGWGCMVRASQMLLANSLFIHKYGRGLPSLFLLPL